MRRLPQSKPAPPPPEDYPKKSRRRASAHVPPTFDADEEETYDKRFGTRRKRLMKHHGDVAILDELH